MFKQAYILEKPEHIETIRNALCSQLLKLENDKQSEEFKSAPLWLVLKINKEINTIKDLLGHSVNSEA